MSDDEAHEYTFESASAGASLTFPMAAGSLCKNGHVVIDNRPCKIVDQEKPSRTRTVHLLGLDIFTGRKHQTSFHVDESANVPNVARKEYPLVGHVNNAN